MTRLPGVQVEARLSNVQGEASCQGPGSGLRVQGEVWIKCPGFPGCVQTVQYPGCSGLSMVKTGCQGPGLGLRVQGEVWKTGIF